MTILGNILTIFVYNFKGGTKCTIAGWGSVAPDLQNPIFDNNLHELKDKPILRFSKCAELWFLQHVIPRKTYTLSEIFARIKLDTAFYGVIKTFIFCLDLRQKCLIGEGSSVVSTLLFCKMALFTSI